MRGIVARGLVVTALAACGGGSGSITPPGDAPGPDAVPGECLPPPQGAFLFDPPEGGQVLLEYLHVDSDLKTALGLSSGISTLARSVAFFLDEQTPEHETLPTPGACEDLVATKGWPLYIGTPHIDVDVGALDLLGKNAARLEVDLRVPAQGAGTDALGRAHDLYYQLVAPGANAFVAPDTAYTVTFGGSARIQAATFADEVFIPADFQPVSPALDDNGPLVVGTDYTVRWTPATSSNVPPGDDVLSLVWLADTRGMPTHVCVTLHAAGQFTIPGASLAEYKAIAAARGAPTSKVLLIEQAVVHRADRCLPNGEPNNQRRLDMLGAVTWAQIMDLQ